MRMRIAFLIGFLVGAWGCGKGDAITNPQPPDVVATATPVPVRPTPAPPLTPKPTPQCANFKLCDGNPNGF